MQDIVVMLFMLITRIGLPVLAVVVAGYLIERWYTAREQAASREETFSTGRTADAGYEETERRKKAA